jgi:hypothetical protein
LLDNYKNLKVTITIIKNYRILRNFSGGAGALFNYSTSSNINPVVSYSNADTLKLQIIKENRKKSGVYC